ncbi:hypothetical protein Bca101_052171 [Brassica carinata]
MASSQTYFSKLKAGAVERLAREGCSDSESQVCYIHYRHKLKEIHYFIVRAMERQNLQRWYHPISFFPICSPQTVVTHLLRFCKARNVKK